MLGGAGPAIGSAAPQAPLLASPAVCQARPVRDRARRSRPRSRPRRGQMPPVMPPTGRTATRPRTPAAAAPSHCAVVQPSCRQRHWRAMAAAQSACPAFPFGVHPWAVTCQSITKASRRLPVDGRPSRWPSRLGQSARSRGTSSSRGLAGRAAICLFGLRRSLHHVVRPCHVVSGQWRVRSVHTG